jgi:hypothetical protein
LREVADTVEEDASNSTKFIGQSCIVHERVLVCVSTYPNSLQLLRRGARIAGYMNAEFFVIFVYSPDRFLTREEALHIETCERLCMEFEGRFLRIKSHQVPEAIAEVAERERVVDVDAILAAVTPRTRLVFIANPANPTGTMVPEAALRRMLEALPPHVIFVHDGAYAEFVEGFDGGAGLVRDYPNVLMTRTFSKVYGLGGLRIGWGHAQRAMIEVMTRVRQPFTLSQAQMAAAEAAVRDRAFLAHCVSENARLRAHLRDALRQMGIGCDESHANFVLARFAGGAEAGACDAAL